MAQSSKIEHVRGRAIAVRGDDIDTDRIIPARYLKTITFDGLGDHLFEDDRAQSRERGVTHPMDQPAYQGASILIAGGNFGCGSSREHAPQSIYRWGIRAVIAQSFAEIFFGNSVMIGLPCVTASAEDIAVLMNRAETHPSESWHLDLAASVVVAGELTIHVHMPPASRAALRSGDWDATALLLDHYDVVQQTASRLPYLNGWA